MVFFQFVIGSTASTLPDLPEPKRKFVIGAAANGAEVKRPLPVRKSAVGAAAVTRYSHEKKYRHPYYISPIEMGLL